MNVRGARVGVKAGPLYFSAPIVPGRSPYGQRAGYPQATQRPVQRPTYGPAPVYRAQPKRGAGHYVLVALVIMVAGFLGMAAIALAAPITIPTAAVVIIVKLVTAHRARTATQQSDTAPHSTVGQW